MTYITHSHNGLAKHNSEAPGFLAKLSSAIVDRLRAFHQQRADNKAIRQLLELNTKQLDDIGLSRGDIIWASRLPRDQNASVELQKIARRR